MNRDELIALARKLYDGGKGLSYGKIADKFNTDGIATPSGKGSWERKMIQRIVSADILNKAEVKVGMKTEVQVRLEIEIDRLKHSIETLENSLVYYKAEKERLESENAGLRSDRDEILNEFNKVKQHLSERTNQINTVYAVNAKLTRKSDRLMIGIKRLYSRNSQSVNVFRSEVERLSIQRDCFKAESERLNRQLVESELKYKTLYESEITRLGSELAIAKQMIQELQDKQTFLKPESESGVPKNFMGWTVGKRYDKNKNLVGYNILRKFSGKLKGLYIGKEWSESDARQKIAAFESKQKPQSELFGTECKSCQHQQTFESRLRQVCPETIRTYRLDTVAGHFPDCNFGSEMIALAEQKRIELLAGDASRCDVSKLVQYRGRMYVNFEWR